MNVPEPLSVFSERMATTAQRHKLVRFDNRSGFRDSGLNFEFRALTLKQLLERVKDGSLDAAVAALKIAPGREKSFDFTHAFYTTGLGIAVSGKMQNPWFTVVKRFISVAFLKVIATLTPLLLGGGDAGMVV